MGLFSLYQYLPKDAPIEGFTIGQDYAIMDLGSAKKKNTSKDGLQVFVPNDSDIHRWMIKDDFFKVASFTNTGLELEKLEMRKRELKLGGLFD